MSIYSIYRITNLVNQKVYIGFTSKKWPKSRWGEHKRASVVNNKNSKCHALINALKKYGTDNFRFEVIYQSKDKDHTLNVMEPYFIELYNSIKQGYNISIGGDAPMLGRKHSEETKAKMSVARKGRRQTDKHKKARSEALKGRIFTEEHISNMKMSFKNRPPKTEEARIKQSNALKGKKFTESHRQNLAAINKLRSVRVNINNVVYDSVYSAASACGVTTNTIRNWKKTGKVIYLYGN